MQKTLDVFALVLPEIKELLAERNFAELKKLLKRLHSMDIAEGLRHLSDPEMIIIFRLLGPKKALEVFEALPLEDRRYLINNLANEEAIRILNEIAADERAELFRELPERIMKKFMALIRGPEAEEVKRILNYPEDTAGGIMTTEFVELKKDMTAKKAILHLQESYHAGLTEQIYSVYVTDPQHHLIGSISLQMLIMAPPDMEIKNIMSPVESIKIEANGSKEDVVKLFIKYDLSDLPIVNEENHLLGIIHVDDVIDEIQKETTTEMYEIGKMTPHEGKVIEYRDATVLDLVKRRAGWLLFLLLFHFVTGAILKNYAHAMTTVIALAFFIPMVLDTGGNAGIQTAITIIRALATGDVTWRNARKVIFMELGAALVMGLLVGTLAYFRASLLQQSPLVALAVGVTMLVIIILAISTGIVLPFLAKRIGLDPAALAGPITTSVVDVVGLIIYFKIAQLFIPIL